MGHKVKKMCKRVFLVTLLGMFSFLSLNAQGGSVTVKGVVKDSQGEPVIGASVVVKGTTVGSMTDLDGRYSVNTTGNATLEISFLGYKTQSVPVNNRTEINVVLQEDTELLDEVVVIGYGTVKKSDATGAVTAIRVDEMNRGLVTSAQDLLGGKIAGVTVTSNSGSPGDGATIRIRGGSSLSATNDPLVIVDGVILSNDLPGSSNFLSMVNPSDIETFTVLKDASATAIYGSRASNGVILITTKKGSLGLDGKGNVRITYNGNFSLSTRRNSVDVMGADEYYRFITDKFYGMNMQDIVIPKLGTASTDWQDEIFRTAFGTDHNISAYGVISNFMPYRISAGYTNQEGIVETSKMERATTNISLTPSFFDGHLNLNINAKGMFSKTRFVDTGAIGSAVSFDPTQPVRNGSIWGGYFTWTNAAGEYASIAGKNPVAMLNMRNNRANVRNFIGNIQADYKLHFFPDLKLNMNLALDVATTGGTDFRDPFNPAGYSPDDNRSGERKDFRNLKNNQLFEFYAQYLKEVASIKSKFDVMAGYSWQRYKKTSNEDRFFVSKEDLSNLDPVNPGVDAFRYNELYLLSFYGRINYTFDNKYLMTFTLRDDGSSRFAKGNRWAVFPALALAWKIKEEPFFKDVADLSDLKLRLGWGETGQQDIGDDWYPSTPSYITGSGQGLYPMGRNPDGSINWVNIMKPLGYNPDLKWETTTTWNVGIDYGFLNNRITGAFDFYYRKTKDLLNREAAVIAGTNLSERLPQNIGSLENKGVEFAIDARPVVTKDFEWQLGFNIAYNRSKITKLNESEDPDFVGQRITSTGGDGGETIQLYKKGEAPRAYYVYQQVYDEQGKPIEGVYVDRDGDGTVDERDLYVYKKPDADVTMGFNSKVVYKNWDFGFNGRVSLGNYVYNAVAANNADISNNSVYANSLFLVNRPVSALETNFTSKQALSDYYVQNGSFLKIDNITLGYSFDNLFKNKMKARVYATVQNPILITKYDGLDPEVFGGIDYNLYPRPLSFLFGVNLNF